MPFRAVADVWFRSPFSLALYIAIQAFGPLMFTESFHYTPGDAAAMCAKFWLGNIGALIVVGVISDKLQMRKPIAILGAVLTAALLVWWIPTFGEALPRRHDDDRGHVVGMLPRDPHGAVGCAVFRSARGNFTGSASHRVGILRTGDARMERYFGATDALRRGEIRMAGVDQILARGGRILWSSNDVHASDHGADSRDDAKTEGQTPTSHRVAGSKVSGEVFHGVIRRPSDRT